MSKSTKMENTFTEQVPTLNDILKDKLTVELVELANIYGKKTKYLRITREGSFKEPAIMHIAERTFNTIKDLLQDTGV